MDKSQLRRGLRVIVDHGEPRGRKEAIVIKVPPFEDSVCGKTRTHTDDVMVQYPGTSIDGGNFFADMSEIVSLDIVESK